MALRLNQLMKINYMPKSLPQGSQRAQLMHNFIIYYRSTTMEYYDEDGLMLNVINQPNRSSQTDVPPPVKATKAQIKQIKYSRKFRSEQSKDKNRRRSEPLLDLLPNSELTPDYVAFKPVSKETEVVTHPKGMMEDREQDAPREEKSHPKRERQYSRPSYDEQLRMRGKVNTNANIVTPIEIKPELTHAQDNIDRTPLAMMNLHRSLTESLVRNSITKLTEIQMKCYPSIYSGKDTIAKASTGSGKTLAYLIPLINQYLESKSIISREDGTIMVVICPSRELCVQGSKEALRCLKRCPYIVPGCLIGGEQTNHQKGRIRKGLGILFCTPGRLLYHLNNTECFKLQKIKTIVFEEADRTLDLGFEANISKILTFISGKVELSRLQKVLVSAHFNQKVETLLKHLQIDNPVYVGFQTKEGAELEDEQQINISENVKQQYLLMSEEERIPLVIAYLRLVRDSKVMIFANTIDEVEYLDFILTSLKYRDSNGNPTDQRVQSRRIFKMHGNLDQKLRSSTYSEFRKERSAVLVSTEVASRGLDFPDLTHILLFDVPPTITDYGNRVGRTARFNCSGVSLLMLHYQESDYAEKIRYYSPTLELLNKDVIYDGFGTYLNEMNIRETSLYYLEGLVRGLIKDDDEKYQLARQAYVSMLRAYAKMKDKYTFAVKKLDLKLLGRGFGINSTGGQVRAYNPKAKESHLEGLRKKRKVQSVRKLQVDEYL